MTYRNIVYLDNAASSFPKPQCVIDRMTTVMRNNTANPGRSGHKLSDANAKLIYDARQTVASFLGIGDFPENIIFTHSATHALNIVINGILQKGDSVIISDMEHNSVLRPLEEKVADGLLDLKIAVTEHEDELTVINFENLIDEKTKMIIVTHASNVNGKVLPIEKLSVLCKKYGIILCVDASQTIGHLDCNLKTLGIDILCASGHKGLFGPQGTGILALNGDIKIRPLIFGGTGGKSLLHRQPEGFPESLESGTQNTVGIAGLSEGIKYLNRFGAKLESNADSLYKLLYNEFNSCKDINVYSEKFNKTHTYAFNIKDKSSEEVTYYLNNHNICVRGGFHCSALFHEKMQTLSQGIVRVSIGGFNSENDIKKLVYVCKKIART